MTPCTHYVRKGLPYYSGLPWFPKKIDAFTYIIAHVEGEDGLREIVGMAQLQVSPHDTSEIWLEFLSVCEEFRQRGISKRLADLTCRFLSDKPWKLRRSRPSDMGVSYLKSNMDRLVAQFAISVAAT